MSEYNESKLQQIQDELMKELDKEQQLENHINISSEQIAAHLTLNSKCKAEINNTPYIFAYKLLQAKGKRIIYIVISNIIKYELAQSKYIPFSATAEVNEQYSLKDNLKTVVEAFIRHITGTVKPDTVADEESYQVFKKEE
jgi:hypothetical protein